MEDSDSDEPMPREIVRPMLPITVNNSSEILNQLKFKQGLITPYLQFYSVSLNSSIIFETWTFLFYIIIRVPPASDKGKLGEFNHSIIYTSGGYTELEVADSTARPHRPNRIPRCRGHFSTESYL